MNVRLKILSGSAVALLLGFGLCGVDSLLPSSKGQEFGGLLSFFGFAICIGSVVLTFVAALSMALAGVIDHFKGRK